MDKTILKICNGKMCSSKFSSYILERAKNDIQNKDLKHIQVESCGCQGNCEKGPTVILEQGGKKERLSFMNPAEIGNVICKLDTQKK